MEGSREVGKKYVKASGINERFLGDSLRKGEWEERKLKEIEIGMKCKISAPFKANSGVGVLSGAVGSHQREV